MADFDAIYEDIQDENEEPLPPPMPKTEPILIRGTGNMTVYVFLPRCFLFLFLHSTKKCRVLLCSRHSMVISNFVFIFDFNLTVLD